MKKVIKTVIILLLVFLCLTTVLWFIPERTPRIKSSNSSSLALLEYIKLGGVDQCVLTRTENTAHPIMLFLHGGPGMPMMFLAGKFQGALEKDFTVVQWDRRGAGKSYTKQIPPAESMVDRQVVNDAYQLIDTLRQRFGKEKIILVGHSWGTYLGSIMVTEHPELFSLFISIGQVVDDKKCRIIQRDFIEKQASKYHRTDILESLAKSPGTNMENWLFEFGGELKNSTTFMPFVWSGLLSPEYTLKDVLNVAKGSNFNQKHMKETILDRSIYFKIREYRLPVYFFVGANDYTTPTELIEEYYKLISAPEKKMVRFENSAHFPFFEEPAKFCNEVKQICLKNSNTTK